jgi:protein-export chaperone SecB
MAEQHSKPDTQPASGGNNVQQFGIQKIYLKDASFEAPQSPIVFTEKWEPTIDLQLGSRSNAIAEHVWEVIITVTVTAKLGDKPAFLVEVQQAGLFVVQGFAESDIGPMLGSFCPNILFPFAREAVAELVSKGGFPQLLLAPINFDALYAQHRQQAARSSADHH